MAAQTERMASVKNQKVQLHELLQKKGERPPEYKVLSRTGPDHRPTFKVKVTVEWEGRQLVEFGKGSSKKVAKNEAAAKALKMILRHSARIPVPKPSHTMIPSFGRSVSTDFLFIKTFHACLYFASTFLATTKPIRLHHGGFKKNLTLGSIIYSALRQK